MQRDFTDLFRPRKFKDLVGQQHNLPIYERWLTKEHMLPKGVLFTGRIGTGKTLTANILARAAACAGRRDNQFEPCGRCQVCQERAFGSIRREVGSRVSAEHLTEVIDAARIVGTGNVWMGETGKWYPVIIDELDEMPAKAQQGLRAQLDQPWANSFVVGTSARPERIDNALLERLHPFNLYAPSRSETAKWVIQICKRAEIEVVDPGSAVIVVDRAEGRFRKMLQILERLRDAGLCLQEDDARKAAEMCGCE